MNLARYKLLLISGGISLVVCGGLIFWILKGASTASSLSSEIDGLRSQQSRLTASDPYPSEANLTALRREQDKVRELRDAIDTAMRENQVVAEPVSRSVFGDYVNDVVPALREMASTSVEGGENGVILLDPDFGLTEYLKGDLPTQNRIDRLVVEIEVLRHLAELLFTAGISELVSIEALESEDDSDEDDPEGAGFLGGGPGMMPGMMPGGRPTRPGQTQEAEGSQIDKERDRMFDAVSFRLEFRAYEDFFWNVLNGLLADDNQVVITSLAVTNSNELLWPEYLKPVGSSQPARRSRAAPRPARRRQNELADLFGMGGEPGELSATLEPQDEVKLAGLEERRQYLVGGDLLRVVMEVKVYRLKPEETETTPEGR